MVCLKIDRALLHLISAYRFISSSKGEFSELIVFDLLSQKICLAEMSPSFKTISIMLTIESYGKIYMIPVSKNICQVNQFRRYLLCQIFL